jgi:hypothetical protein
MKRSLASGGGAKTNTQLLEFQCDRIEAVLARYKISSRVLGGAVLPRWIRFNLVVPMGTAMSKVSGLGADGYSDEQG